MAWGRKLGTKPLLWVTQMCSSTRKSSACWTTTLPSCGWISRLWISSISITHTGIPSRTRRERFLPTGCRSYAGPGRPDRRRPDLPPPGFILESMFDSATKPNTHGYMLGLTQPYRAAVANYYQNRFGVELDPKTEVVDLIGSKEGLFILSQVMLNPGDVALVPDPAYAVYAKGAEIAGAKPYSMPLLEKNAFLPDFEAIPDGELKKAKILWLNYPNNPTGAIADLAFFEVRQEGVLP